MLASNSSFVLGARVGAGKYSYSVNPSAFPGADVFALLAQLKVTFVDSAIQPTMILTTNTRSVKIRKLEFKTRNLSFKTEEFCINENFVLKMMKFASWEVSSSPIVWENLYNGEVYDDRLSPPADWATPAGVAASASALASDSKKSPEETEESAGWVLAEVVALPDGAEATLSARLFPPIRVTEVVPPSSNGSMQIAPHSFMFDLGNNFAGVAKITFGASFPFTSVRPGDTMTVVCTEYLAVASVAGGEADMYNQQDMYIFSGMEKAADSYAPAFVYHGFRYIRVDFNSSSLPSGLKLSDFTAEGLYMHSDVERHGIVSVGDGVSDEGATLDAIHKIVLQTQRDNIHSLPTDCPQREKRGWMGECNENAVCGFPVKNDDFMLTKC